MSDPGPKRTLYEGKFIRLVQRGRWEYAERAGASGAVVIVALTREGKLLLTEQHRIPVEAAVIELPAGLVGDLPDDADEEWEAAAARELEEETGYRARRIKFLTEGPVSAGFGNEMVAFCLARQLTKVGPGGGVEHENITVHEVPLERVAAWLKRQTKAGKLIDPKVYAGLYFLLQERRSSAPPG